MSDRPRLPRFITALTPREHYEVCPACGEKIEVLGYSEHHMTDIIRCGCCAPLPGLEPQAEASKPEPSAGPLSYREEPTDG